MATAVGSSRSAVLNLYKQILWAGRDYPAGLDVIRRGAKKAFLSMRNEQDPEKIKQALSKGEYVLKELEALVKLHKYRTLNKTYNQQVVDERLQSFFQKHKGDFHDHVPHSS